MKKINFIVYVAIQLSLSTSLVTFVGCGFVQGNHSSSVSHSTQEFPKIERLSSTQSLAKGTMSLLSVAISDSGKYFATLSGEDNLFYFDQTSSAWQPVEFFPRIDWPLNFVSFVDAKNGFITGNGGVCLKTSDGGETWTQVPQFTNHNLGKIAFADSSIGYVTSERSLVDDAGAMTYTLEIFKTTDGGDTWKTIYPREKVDGSVFDIAVKSSNELLVIVGGNKLLRTGDGGKTWQYISTVDGITSVAFTSDGTGWLVSDRGLLLRSDDSGQTWYEPDKLSTKIGQCRWWSVDIDASGFGVVVSEDGCLGYTKDGKNWKKLNAPVNEHFRRVVIRGQKGIIIGTNGVYEIHS